MEYKLSFLWTDILFFILLFLLVIFVYFAQRNVLFKEACANVFSRPIPVFVFVIILSYLVIAILDSIHFYTALPALKNGTIFYSTDIESVFDVLVQPLGVQQAQTFTAPFSLRFNASDHLFFQLALACVWSFVVWFAVGATMLLFSSYRHHRSMLQTLKLIRTGKANFAWKSALLAAAFVIFAFAITVTLSKYFHIFGTNKIGEDVYYQALKSIRTGILIGSLTTLFMIPFAVIFGTAAGYFRGIADDIIQYIYTTLSSIPGVLLITAAILSLQLFTRSHPQLFTTLAERADARLLILCAILGVTSWTDLCRIIRGETLKLREVDFVQAAIVMGVPSYKIILRHIIPNVSSLILITVVLQFSILVLAEAVLSYVGVGVDPSTISWGNIINSARFELARDPVVWWPLTAAFIFMFGLVLSVNLFADAIRDAFDPRLHGLNQAILGAKTRV